MNIILINGHSGSLKTSLGYFLSANLSYALIPTAFFGYFAADKAFDIYRQARYIKALYMAEEYLKNGCSIILDGNFPKRKIREKVYKMAQSHDIKEIITVTCFCGDLSILKERFLFRKNNPLVPDGYANSMDAYYGSSDEYEDIEKDEIEMHHLTRIKFDSCRLVISLLNPSKAGKEICHIVKQLITEGFFNRPLFLGQ